MTPENRNIVRQRIGKLVPTEMNMHATIEEPVYKQRTDKHNNRDIVGNSVFYSVRAKWVY
jgi:hypothetical protein